MSPDEAIVCAYLNITSTVNMAPSTFALMLEHALADKKNGTIHGMSKATHKKVFHNRTLAQQMGKIPVAMCENVSQGLETMIESVMTPTVMPKRFADLGAYGVVHEDDEGEDSEGSDSEND